MHAEGRISLSPIHITHPRPSPGKLVFDKALQAYNINSAIFKVGRNADAASPLTGAQGAW